MGSQPTFNYSTADEVIDAAKHIMESMMEQRDTLLTSPDLVRQYLMMRLGRAEREIFCVIFLDNQNRLIAADDLFMGTIDGASVYPREVLKAALKYNAAAVLLAHNHPSGNLTPSDQDRDLTKRILRIGGLMEISVLDHLIVGGGEYLSFADQGWLIGGQIAAEI